MSKYINIKWECPACLNRNADQCPKPKPFQPTIYNSSCEYCSSQARLKVWFVKGQAGLVNYDFVDFSCTEKGAGHAQDRMNANPDRFKKWQGYRPDPQLAKDLGLKGLHGQALLDESTKMTDEAWDVALALVGDLNHKSETVFMDAAAPMSDKTVVTKMLNGEIAVSNLEEALEMFNKNAAENSGQQRE